MSSLTDGSVHRSLGARCAPGRRDSLTETYILSLSCRDRSGLVADIASLIVRIGGNIVDAQQFNEKGTGEFFMRVVFVAPRDPDTLVRGLSAMRPADRLAWQLRPIGKHKRVLLLVSKFGHCLNDLLYRWRMGELPMQVVGVVSNHPRETLNVNMLDGIPFHHLPVTKETRSQQESQIKTIVEQAQAELVVLARYMQILSDDLASFLAGRCINIHHSFLPGFKGAKPYEQAHARGVKMIGATAHYVTADLDEGPIIHQDVEQISHSDMPEDLIRKGRDVECRVLARAVQWHLQDRVFASGAKTIVFRD
jgi:formyltetrahydrofolate deformylase